LLLEKLAHQPQRGPAVAAAIRITISSSCHRSLGRGRRRRRRRAIVHPYATGQLPTRGPQASTPGEGKRGTAPRAGT
jgi:hypothetical protein